MKKILFISILLSFYFHSSSQTSSSDDAMYEPGIYRTFEELKYGEPSIRIPIEVITKNRGGAIFYKIKIDRQKAKSIGIVMGFCDGTNVYIMDDKPFLIPRTEFSKLEFISEDFCYYIDLDCGFNPNVAGNTSCAVIHKIIDINTGNTKRFSKKSLVRLLKEEDEELFLDYKEEILKYSKIKEYLFKYYRKKYPSDFDSSYFPFQ